MVFGKKKIIPVPKEPPENPYAKASFLSKITYSWENKLFKVGFNRPLQNNDLYLLTPKFKEENNEKQFYHHWNDEIHSHKDIYNLMRCYWKMFGKDYICAGVLRFTADAVSLITPVILELLLNFLENSGTMNDNLPNSQEGEQSLLEKIKPYMGWVYISGIFLCQVIYLVCDNYYSKIVLEIGISVRATNIGAIYRKTLKLSNKELQNVGPGKIVNMVSTDSFRVQQVIVNGHSFWSSPLQLLVILVLLVRSLGVWSLIGFSIFLFIVPIQGVVMKLLISLRKKTAVSTDERVKKTQEILGNIRIIKYFGWEKIFQRIVDELRQKELKCTKKGIIINAETTAIFNIIPFFASAITFIAYCANGNILTAAKVFSCHSLFNKLCVPLSHLSTAFSQLTNGLVSYKRIAYLMNCGEIEEFTEIDPTADFGVSVKNGHFNWEIVRPEDVIKKKKDEKRIMKYLIKHQIKREKKPKKNDLKKEMKKRHRYSRLEDIASDGMDFMVDNSNLSSKIMDDMIQKTSSTDDLGHVVKQVESFRLSNINIRIKKGSLTAVVGMVGSGKSSLINAIIGEMKKESGRVIIGGSFSYCSQKAWIRNATVRDNIILGKPFDKERYDKAVENCALLRDFELFSNGDMTEMSERGANLSGGQKQRINLARAVYDNSDVVFMDDPLSAVDAHVSRFLFDNCICGSLQNKTRILVTHQLHLLPKVDYIIVMKDGRIEEQGEYKELMQRNGELFKLMKAYGDRETEDSGIEEEEEEEGEDLEDTTGMVSTFDIFDGDGAELQNNGEENDKEGSKGEKEKEAEDEEENKIESPFKKKPRGIISKEERPTGSVKWKIYAAYIKAGGGYIIGLFVLLLVGILQLLKIGSDMWLVYWTEDSLDMETNNYILVYLGWNVCQTLVMFFYYVFMVSVGIKSARTVHNRAIKNVMKAPVFFFDSNPLGRIINRFSMDQDALDNNLFLSIQILFTSLASTISTFALMLYAAPILGVALVPLLMIYLYIQQMFRYTSRELKRIDALTRSPLYANIAETIDGLATIRTYHEQEHLIKYNQFLIDENNRPIHLQSIAKKWLGFRLELIGAILVLFDGIAGMFLKDTLSVSLLGLSLSYALQVTSNLNSTVRYFCNTEVYMNSAERLLHYSEEIEIEKQEGKEAPVGWPEHGKIEIRNLTMQYAPYLPATLHNVNVNINAHEKVGIVGRTGAGKSSIIMSLFRMVEPDLYSVIKIDDENTLNMKLSNVRHGLSIIPQEPILFSGTLRFNLDPFEEHTDNEIWQALEHSGLKYMFMNTDKKLESEVSCNGENFSVGQRQLLCLARAMIKNSHVLVMDEATASCDAETDAIIQKAVRNNFNEATVITIAHRLNTIIDYDKILVLDKGKVVEFDSPVNLLFENGPNGELVPSYSSEFSKLVDETGPANAEALRQMALQSIRRY